MFHLTRKYFEDTSPVFDLRNGKPKPKTAKYQQDNYVDNVVEGTEAITIRDVVRYYEEAPEFPEGMSEASSYASAASERTRLLKARKAIEKARIGVRRSQQKRECPSCTLTFASNIQVAQHLLNRHQKVKCNMCRKSFLDSQDFKKHLTDVHVPQMVNSFAEQMQQRMDKVIENVVERHVPRFVDSIGDALQKRLQELRKDLLG